MRPRWLPDVRFRKRGESGFLVKGAEALELNEVGVFIWRQCDGSKEVEQIAADLAREFDVAADLARADCEAYVGRLADLRLVEDS